MGSRKTDSPRDNQRVGLAYSLGRGLFLDLYGTLVDEAFRRGFGRLYVAMRDGERDDECSGLERGLCYVESRVRRRRRA